MSGAPRQSARWVSFLTLQWIASALAAPTIDPDCMSSPQRCDCFSYFGLNYTNQVDREDVKQGFRSFSKYAHPDKHPGEQSQWERVMMFGNACNEFLREDMLSVYKSRLAAALALSRKRAWSTDKLHDRVEELHEELGVGIGGSGGSRPDEPVKPRFEKRGSPTEKMHMFLDNSVSFQCGLSEAADLVSDIFPRLERTPTSVHLMASRSKTRQLFSETDDFVMDDILRYWTAKEEVSESLDVLFMMDVTGSMESAIYAAVAKVVEIGEGLQHHVKSVRLGFLGYRDMSDDEQFVQHQFTSDWHDLRDWLRRTVRADGGDDIPENVIGALEEAMRSFSWGSERRLLVHILDAPGHAPRGGQKTSAHWLKKLAGNGVEYTMLQVGGSVEPTASEYKSHFDAASPIQPMTLTALSSCTPDSFKAIVMDAAFEATPHAKGTFMWEYIFGQLKARGGRDQDVVILTDGHDNASGSRFLGTEGFNYMMELLLELGMALPRITVYCFCNEECTKGRYKQLAMASGGAFFSSSEPGSKDAFKRHMLLSHAERVTFSRSQMQEYEQITPEGSRFGWYTSVVPVSGAPSGGAWGMKCEVSNGASVCSRKTKAAVRH